MRAAGAIESSEYGSPGRQKGALAGSSKEPPSREGGREPGPQKEVAAGESVGKRARQTQKKCATRLRSRAINESRITNAHDRVNAIRHGGFAAAGVRKGPEFALFTIRRSGSRKKRLAAAGEKSERDQGVAGREVKKTNRATRCRSRAIEFKNYSKCARKRQGNSFDVESGAGTSRKALNRRRSVKSLARGCATPTRVRSSKRCGESDLTERRGQKHKSRDPLSESRDRIQGL